jgi:rubrerythrin
MESLDIAKDFFKSGDFDEAATYAREAESAVAAAGETAAGEQAKPDVGKLACPGCGEELSPEWGACPICGHKTR